MTAKEMSDDNFIKFQDDFYNLLEKYGVSSIDCEHEEFAEIINLRNRIAEFIEQELYKQEEYSYCPMLGVPLCCISCGSRNVDAQKDLCLDCDADEGICADEREEMKDVSTSS
jgi:hypothetical protein|tara:strand:- start:1609 stop:1947 length:339 start_codon:yes stop_codon:yes gene_type:complete